MKRLALILLLLFSAAPAWADVDYELNIRASIAHCTDPTNNTYFLGPGGDANDGYSTTRTLTGGASITFGWTDVSGRNDIVRDDDVHSSECRLGGHVFSGNDGASFTTFRLDNLQAGSATIHLADGTEFGSTRNFVTVYDSDGTTVLMSTSGAASSANQIRDANDAVWSITTWVANETGKAVTLSGDHIFVKVGALTTTGDGSETKLINFRVVQTGGTTTTTTTTTTVSTTTVSTTTVSTTTLTPTTTVSTTSTTLTSGVAPEVCGNGIDDPLQTGGSANGTKGSCPGGYHDSVIGNGCDADCDSPDKDNDGYTSDGTLGKLLTTNTDCDDTRSDIYPGVWTTKGCTAGNAHYCDTDGAYKDGPGGSTASSGCVAVTGISQATGSGVRRFVDCGNSLGSASDSNAGTSRAAPKLTLTATAALVNPGDNVVVIGTGTCTENTIFSRAGTTGTGVIHINREPGSTAKLDGTDQTLSITGDFYHVDDLDVDGVNVAVDIAANDMELSRTYAHDIAANGDNNGGCIKEHGGNRSYIHNNFARDCLRASGNVQNVSGFTWLDSTGQGTGADHRGYFNTCWYTVNSSTTGGNCFFIKHGVSATEAGVNGMQIKWNSAVNYPFIGLWSGTSKLRAFFNRFVEGGSSVNGIAIGDVGGSLRNEDVQIKNNFIRGASDSIKWDPLYTATESLVINGNHAINTTTSYSPGNCNGILRIDAYGSDAHKALMDAGNPLLAVDGNCYYSPNATAEWCYFGGNSDAGGIYTFAQWQALTFTSVGVPYHQDLLSSLGNFGAVAPKFTGTGACATSGWNPTTVIPSPPSTGTNSTIPISLLLKLLGGSK